MKIVDWCITKWCKSITDSGKDEYTHNHIENATQKFRMLDDDGVVYCYGEASNDVDFEPLDDLGEAYGCTDIQYKNQETGEYESL